MEENEKLFDEQHPSTIFDKSKYTFTRAEKSEIDTYNVIIKLGKIADVAIRNMLNSMVLPRVGVRQSPDNAVLYDAGEGNFTVWTPKEWCDACKIRRATHFEKTNQLCEVCWAQVKPDSASETPASEEPKKTDSAK